MIDIDPDPRSLRERLEALGYRVEPHQPGDPQYTKRLIAPDGTVTPYDSVAAWELVRAQRDAPR